MINALRFYEIGIILNFPSETFGTSIMKDLIINSGGKAFIRVRYIPK
jgi:hypothetical protein